MNTTTTPRKTKTIGNVTFVLPFRISGFYIVDARGDHILEARSTIVAKDLLKILEA